MTGAYALSEGAWEEGWVPHECMRDQKQRKWAEYHLRARRWGVRGKEGWLLLEFTLNEHRRALDSSSGEELETRERASN